MEGVEFDWEPDLLDDLVKALSQARRDQAAGTGVDPSWHAISPWRRGLGASKGKRGRGSGLRGEEGVSLWSGAPLGPGHLMG